MEHRATLSRAVLDRGDSGASRDVATRRVASRPAINQAVLLTRMVYRITRRRRGFFVAQFT